MPTEDWGDRRQSSCRGYRFGVIDTNSQSRRSDAPTAASFNEAARPDYSRRMSKPGSPWRAAIIVNLTFVALGGATFAIARAVRGDATDCTAAARPFGEIGFERHTRRGYEYIIWGYKDGTPIYDYAHNRAAVAFTENGSTVASVGCLDAERVAGGFQLTDDTSP